MGISSGAWKDGGVGPGLPLKYPNTMMISSKVPVAKLREIIYNSLILIPN
jgi:hypothetical protein